MLTTLITCCRRYGSVALTWVALSGIPGPAFSYEFRMGWDDPFPVPEVIDAYNAYSLSPNKRIRIQGERLVDDRGEAHRFWGVGLRLTRGFPAKSAAETEKVIAKIASLGFTTVRLIGWDFEDPGFYKQWVENGHADPVHMRRVCDLISTIKRHGMRYAISANHYTGRFDGRFNAIRSKNSRHGKGFKAVQLYDEDLIDETIRWYDYVLGTKHPGCDLRFAEDPALLYLDAVNEDSIFDAFAKEWRYLSARNEADLNRLFENYATRLYGSMAAATTAWGVESNAKLTDFPRKRLNKQMLTDKGKKLASDVVSFLQSIDERYFDRIGGKIRSLGYRGPLSFTNNWYGYGSLKTSIEKGDIVEMHFYFDPPRSESVWDIASGDVSFLKALQEGQDIYGETESWRVFPLYRLFASAVEGMPLIVSEWNHGGESEFAHEGPVLALAYSSLLDVAAMDLHTYLTRRGGHKSTCVTDGFGLVANPSVLALMPSISLAYRSGLLADGEHGAAKIDFQNSQDFSERVVSLGNRVAHGDAERSIQDDLNQPVRKSLFKRPPAGSDTGATPAESAATAGVRWFVGSDPSKGMFVIDRPGFKAGVGSWPSTDSPEGIGYSGPQESFALVAHSLDFSATSTADYVFITVAGAVHNPAKREEGVCVEPKLRSLSGNIELTRDDTSGLIVEAISPDGTIRRLTASCSQNREGNRVWSIPLDGLETPWIQAKKAPSFALCRS